MKPSMDPLAIEGFKSLGKEIHNQLPKIKELYTFVTSGASFIGIYQSLKENNIQPKMYAVKGIAGKLGTSHSPLQKQVNRILAETGSGTIEIDEETLNKFKMDFPSLQLSDESLSSLAAALQNNAGPNSLVISTGKKWTLQDPAFNPSTIPSINSFEECDNLFA